MSSTHPPSSRCVCLLVGPLCFGMAGLLSFWVQVNLSPAKGLRLGLVWLPLRRMKVSQIVSDRVLGGV